MSGVDASAISQLAAAGAATVADALGSTGVLDPAVRPVWPGARVFGPAFTVRCYPNSIITVHKALLEAQPGDVLVVDAGNDASGALFGAMMATDAQQQRIAGLVTDGAVRDTANLAEMGFPVFARQITPRVGTNRRVGTTGETVACAGAVVRPGDYVLGDADGVVVIPIERVAEIAAAVVATQQKEDDWRRRMLAGERLADLIGFRSLIYPSGKQ
jgi:4-hydroxy-4-methyl-2-oxoglutarate aldolase